MLLEITSSSNSQYKAIKGLRMKKNRTEQGLFIVEGLKSVSDALSIGAPVKKLVFSRTFADQNVRAAGKFADCGAELIVVSDKIFNDLCDTQTPQGVLGIVSKPDCVFEKQHILKGGFYIYCDRLQDPGNAGTIIRTADAFGALGVLFSKGSADIYAPKTVRSTMGSLFHLPVYEESDTASLELLKQSGFRVVAGALNRKAVLPQEIDFLSDTVLVIGNEANGISDEVAGFCDQFVKIPIYGRAESLNASVAASVLMYEAVRRRNAEDIQA